MPFSITLNETDLERIEQAWKSDHHYCGPNWLFLPGDKAALRFNFSQLQWDSSESPRPDIEIRWEIHPPRVVVGHFNFLGNPDRRRFRRSRGMRMSAMDTIEEFEAALKRKGLDSRQFRSVADTYERLLACVNPIPERDEIHELVGYDL
jgi:hypothetical protein